MPLSSGKRAFIAVAAVLLAAVIATGFYVYRTQRPLAGASSGAAPDILNLLPPDAPALAYIDVAALRKLQGTQIAALLGLTDVAPEEDRDYQDFVRGTGFDYTRDLDRAAIALWPVAAPAPAGQLGENRVVAIADGRFDQAKIEAYALRTGKLVTRGAQSIYEVPGQPPASFEFLSSTRIALSSGAGAENLLPAANSAGTRARDPATQSRIHRVAGAPIFAVARTDNLPPSAYDALKGSPQFATLARSIQGLTLAGQPDGTLIHLTLDAECDSMKSAAEIAILVDSMRMFGSMALSDPKTRRQMTPGELALAQAVIGKAEVSHQDQWVRLKLDITPEMLGASGANSADPPQK